MKATVFLPKKETVYLHAAPDIRADVCDEVLFGTRLTALAEANEKHFLQVRTAYGYEGYADVRHLLVQPPDLPANAYTVALPFCDLRPAPTGHARPLLTLSRGSTLYSPLPRLPRARFMPVWYAGHTVFAPTKSLVPQKPLLTGLAGRTDETMLRKKLCDDALAYLGVPYRYGGKSMSGIDCSGLCFMAYAMNGLALFRDAVFDKRYVYDIAMHDLLPGDLLYFSGHIALYIGDGEYVHASASVGYVTVSSFDARSVIYRRDLAGNVRHYARSLLL